VHDPLDTIGDVDIIYVSHIHPDHYDPSFLKKYFDRFGEKQVIIANHRKNYLNGKMKGDGIIATILEDDLIIRETTIAILPHDNGSSSSIDSAIVIKFKEENRTHCVVNANDIIFDDDMRKKLKQAAGEVDILLCGYTGAGPYPQTYFDLSDPQIIEEAKNKKNHFFERYKTLIDDIQSKINIPFAGKYILGGKLARLNYYRGVADPVEVLGFDNRAIVLADNGGWISTADLIPHGVRKDPYARDLIDQRIRDISSLKMDYERLIAEDEVYQLPLKRLLAAAARNACAKSECERDYYFCFHLPSDEYAVINASRNHAESVKYVTDEEDLPLPRSVVDVDPRYLFGLLTHVYHWNNAEVGSHCTVRRTPNELDRSAQSFLNFLAV